MCVLRCLSCVQLFETLLWPASLLYPWDFPGKNTGSGVGCYFLLPDPRIESVSPGSPVLAGGFFTTSATWEAPPGMPHLSKALSPSYRGIPPKINRRGQLPSLSFKPVVFLLLPFLSEPNKYPSKFEFTNFIFSITEQDLERWI